MRHPGTALLPAILALCTGCLLTASCDRRTPVLAYCPTPVEGWEPGDTLKYHIDSLAAAGRYRLSLGVRTSATMPYPFKSLWLVVRRDWHRPDTTLTDTRVDTVEVRLTDQKGDVNGRGVSLYEYSLPLEEDNLSQGTTADIRIIHIMRREVLPGVTDVGIRLDRLSTQP